MPQVLSAKERSLFQTVVRNYEDKQYKKGIKAADQILKKNAKHGDTLAMKALIMNSQGKTEEAFALAKVALQCDMKSHVCWHVYGLLWRAVKNFEEAIKAYKFALRLEPESAQIQRDLALLQIQMRDYQGYIVSRKSMLQSRSHIRQNWTALAVAHHLNGELAEAEGVLTTYEETLKNPPSKTDFENSEAVMYKNSLIAEQGDYQKALDHLESAGKHNLDRLAILELRATYLTKLGKKEEATKAYRALIERNSEYKKYYDGLVEAMAIDAADHKALKAVYDEYAEKYPRNDAARRLPLDFLDGDDFRETADKYIHRMLDKGVPSTFANLKHLYSSSFKRETLPSLVQQYINSGKSEANEEPKRNGDTSKGASSAYYFLAQHYSYYLSRDLDKALEYIEKAIDLEPQSVDFHMTKARIWKHYGDSHKASEIMEQARTLDNRDRHINTKAAKYQLRNNENEAAIKTMGMFTRAETVGGPLADLHDMQCVWFLTEDGQSYARQGKVGLALKRFMSIYNIFDVWQEDQFDFHSFSLRKGQIRAYVDMIRWEDKLREHPFYTRAALSAVDLYLKLHDKPLANGTNGAADGDEDASERKKAAKKARKEAQKAEREALARKNEPNKATKEGDSDPKKKDDDPDGAKLAATTEPMTDAMKFLTPLLQFSPNSIDAQIAGFEVYIRRKKYLLALRCLLAASALDNEHSKVHSQTIRFKLALDKDLATLPPKVAEIIKSEFTLLPESVSLTQFNNDYLSKYEDCARRTLSGLSARKLLAHDLAPSTDADVVKVLKIDNVAMEEAVEGLELLQSWKSGALEAFRKAAAAKWPNATVFAASS
ncbi:N-alpha-acetyltransferase, NatA auxiliary subunit [Lachnellula hyalina]|uniref:N-alpha-acetyltransferase, NatA auxiliary subunit n=1 Tax=Lachnellula hyalina TaxID=1316788 RepID=A0A8H8R0G0_9HELO|nr:N-alpha-acetyltransferase, NatA auxiliary subunit [Lachnellula hyalina]TVY25801.1 N-alpha-acetyltransferase, NatA auxiliary subunit [Lachnellula hyalina]